MEVRRLDRAAFCRQVAEDLEKRRRAECDAWIRRTLMQRE